jgi:hypothetical protein
MSESATLFWLRFAEWGLLASGAILVIGLIGEYRLPTWHWRLGLFELLVLIGCAGELLSDAGVFWSSEHLQQVERSRVVSLEELANEADGKARQAVLDSGTAISKAAEAKDMANGSVAKAGQAKTEAGIAQKQADAVEQKSEDLRIKLGEDEDKRAELEKSLITMATCSAPRVIPFWTVGNTSASIDPLKRFAGRHAVIEVVADDEARRAASSLARTLVGAGWKIDIPPTPPDQINDGVEVQVYPLPSFPTQLLPEQVNGEWESHLRSSEAVDALVDFLHSYNWQARSGWPIRGKNDVPRDGLKIMIGLDPAVVYVTPPGAKDIADALSRSELETQEVKKKRDEEQRKREEAIVKNLTPQQAAEFMSRRERDRALEKSMEERYLGPCQTLSGLTPHINP